MHPMMDAKYMTYKAWIDGILAEQEQNWAARQAVPVRPGLFQRVGQLLGLNQPRVEPRVGTACC